LETLILAQTGCYRKFNIEAQPCFCLFLPAPSAAERKFNPPALGVIVDFAIGNSAGAWCDLFF
jgi:hypothetical protein